jgi:hypothetical protein
LPGPAVPGPARPCPAAPCLASAGWLLGSHRKGQAQLPREPLGKGYHYPSSGLKHSRVPTGLFWPDVGVADGAATLEVGCCRSRGPGRASGGRPDVVVALDGRRGWWRGRVVARRLRKERAPYTEPSRPWPRWRPRRDKDVGAPYPAEPVAGLMGGTVRVTAGLGEGFWRATTLTEGSGGGGVGATG